MGTSKIEDITYPLNVERYEAELEDEQHTEGTIDSSIGFTASDEKVDPARVGEHVLPDIQIEDPHCYIKIINIKNAAGKQYQKYFLKAGGRQGGLYNPWGTYTAGTESLQSAIKGKPVWDFIPVSRSIFIKYTKFLKTRNASWLHNAEREQKNG